YEALYGQKKDTGLLWGRAIKGQVRKIDSIIEDEDKIVIEGKVVKTMDKDGGLQTFVEHETRKGFVILCFNLCDETNGITLKIIFKGSNDDAKAARRDCNELKNKLKLGTMLRVQGNVARDKFMMDEFSMQVTGLMKLDVEEKPRLDEAPEKRVELHCHTKMSKMDGLTPMADLVKQAIKWGHKALAITDHGVVQAFPFCYDAAEGSDLKLIFGMEGYLISDRTMKGADMDQEPTDTIKKSRTPKIRSHHIILLAKNETGLRNLYKMVTVSHLRHFNKRPLLPRDVISQYREGIIVGSACEAGELYQAVRSGASDAELEEIASFYDYLEIQPTGNNMFLVREGYCTVEDLKEHNRKIYELGKRLGKLVVATCDVHFLNPEDARLRTILQAAQNYKDADLQPPLYLHTTEEMLEEFAYLGEDIAYEVVVTNTNKIADMVQRIKPVPDRDQLYSPAIPGAEDAVRDLSYAKAHAWYGDKLPQIVEDRLKMELDAIIGNGFSVLYYIAHKLVKHSLDRGYLVGSRGSVGSSFVATMLDITEVNALKPHYRCPKCRHSEFFVHNEVDSGFDLPVKACPECGTEMVRDGHDIPFAVFLGFHGDKVPDIDLNFSGGYDPDDPSPHPMSDQEVAHKYTEELFGRDNVCRAGTIATVANKTAVGYIKKYYEENNRHVHPAKIAELVEGLAGIKRTTGQHPGGIMVVPRNMDIHYITPMNHPADKPDEPTITTHYDYHSINDRLVKLDILGHDDPMVLKMLEKYMKEEVDPDFDPKLIPVGDEETMRIFQNTTSLGVEPDDIGSTVGTYGIPECGTSFVRQMIHDVQPKNFSEVVRVSGYSHGTDVWLNNAQDLIKEGKPVAETISTRDDIMTHLISKGVEPSLAFKTMEHVRKGKAAKKGLEPKMLEAMKAAKIPDWYIKSCEKVQYLFPKAHAVAYVLMA
ncbi:MAG: PolC-type DNA polymerase III, partial [Phascolarctobacterium sp.]